MADLCCGCRAALTSDEVAITRRLINRGTTRFYCRSCLAEAFGLTTEDVDRAISYYRRIGCTLFRN